MNQDNLATFLWGVADLLRGTLKQSPYGRVILPFTVLRWLECVLEPTRDKVLKVAAQAETRTEDQMMHGRYPRALETIVLHAMNDHEQLAKKALETHEHINTLARPVLAMIRSRAVYESNRGERQEVDAFTDKGPRTMIRRAKCGNQSNPSYTRPMYRSLLIHGKTPRRSDPGTAKKCCTVM